MDVDLRFRQRLAASVMLGAFCGLQSCGVIRAGLEILDSPENQQRLETLLSESGSRQDKLRAGLSLANATLKAEREARERLAEDAGNDDFLNKTLLGGGAGAIIVRNWLSDRRKAKLENEVRGGARAAPAG